MHSVTQLTGWNGMGTGARTSLWEQWVHSMVQWQVGCVGAGLVPSTLLWGTHCPARSACGQRDISAMARVYRLPPTSAWLVAFGGQSLGRAGPGWSCLTHGNLLNQLEVLPAGGRHVAHTCRGSSATELPCNGAHTAPAVRLLFPVPASCVTVWGGHPSPSLIVWITFPLVRSIWGRHQRLF